MSSTGNDLAKNLKTSEEGFVDLGNVGNTMDESSDSQSDGIIGKRKILRMMKKKFRATNCNETKADTGNCTKSTFASTENSPA